MPSIDLLPQKNKKIKTILINKNENKKFGLWMKRMFSEIIPSEIKLFFI